ncbi:MAG: hypothetical protein QNJ72_26255 [Pleurocapsa sp. MO_226.B13]|nr:hypothetical protein [Pleurocapsa sp. MO_226.B13]
MAYRYRYPGEEWITISGDNYTLEDVPGEPTETYKVTCEFTYLRGGTGRTFGYSCNNIARGESDRDLVGQIIGYEMLPLAFNQPVRFNFRSVDANGDDVYTTVDFYILTANGIGTGQQVLHHYGTCAFDYGGKDFRNFEYVATNNFVPTTRCLFRVYSGVQIVYQETRNVCPEVEDIEQEECPPGTCKVICGNVACCYGSDGIAVSSFNL